MKLALLAGKNSQKKSLLYQSRLQQKCFLFSTLHQALKYEESQKHNRDTIFSLYLRHEGKLITSEIHADSQDINQNSNLTNQVNNHSVPQQVPQQTPQDENSENQEDQVSISNQICELTKKKLGKIIKNHFDREWKLQINHFPKADSYKKFKSCVKMENYLQSIKSRRHRVTLTKYRLSDHVLMIETGRHRTPVIPRASRFCPHCLNKVEDEQHFLTDCVAYDRSALMARFSEHCPQFERLDSENKFIYLMSQEDEELTKFLALSLHEWMMQRLD